MSWFRQAEDIGVEVADDYTLRVIWPIAPYFRSLLTHQFFGALSARQSKLEPLDQTANIVTSGAYKFPSGSLMKSSSKTNYGCRQCQLDSIVFYPMDEQHDDEYYKAGEWRAYNHTVPAAWRI